MRKRNVLTLTGPPQRLCGRGRLASGSHQRAVLVVTSVDAGRLSLLRSGPSTPSLDSIEKILNQSP